MAINASRAALSSPFLTFELDLARGAWNLEPTRAESLVVRAARLRAAYRAHSGESRAALTDWRAAQLSGPQQVLPSPHGPLQALRVDFPVSEDELTCTLHFALAANEPLFLWRLNLANRGMQPIYLGRLTLLEARFAGLEAPAFFSNGWGSWDYTGTYGPGDRFRGVRLGFLTRPMRLNPGTPGPTRRGHFAADMFGVMGDRRSRVALLAGFLSQCQHFGSLEAHLATHESTLQLWANGDDTRLDPGASQSTDWACLHFLDVDQPDPLGVYYQAVARQNDLLPGGRRPPGTTAVAPAGLEAGVAERQAVEPLTGWCTWYHFFTRVSAGDVRRNLAALSAMRPGLPLDLVQIDDGFEACPGDWLDFAPSFPDGLAPLVREIRAADFIPGLWLAPFILQRHSRLYREHPDWLLRGQLNRPVNAGFIWNTFTTALDLSHPGALDYVQRVIRTAVHEWGFPYLKLDFLYAGALAGRRHDLSLSRAQILRRALELVRQEAGENTFLLGCGCPLGSALGLVDAMRIGPDVDVRWPARFFGIGWRYDQEPGIPSVRNAVHNTLTRSGMHNRWWLNDPDCLLLRPSTELTLAEVQTLATAIAFSGGLALFSDDLPQVPPERLDILRAILPPIGQAPRVLDWFESSRPSRLRLDLSGAAGNWHLLALINWQDNPQLATLRLAEFDLPQGDYWVRRFWDEDAGAPRRFSGGALDLGELPPHGVAVLTLRRALPGEPQYLGSDLHISQGLEVSGWKWLPQQNRLSLALYRPGNWRGRIYLALPCAPADVQVDGQPCAWEPAAEEVYGIEVKGEGDVDVVVRRQAVTQSD